MGVIVVRRVDCWVLGWQEDASCWFDLPPGLEVEHGVVQPGDFLDVHVMNIEEYRRPRPPQDVTVTGVPVLRVVGFEAGATPV